MSVLAKTIHKTAIAPHCPRSNEISQFNRQIVREIRLLASTVLMPDLPYGSRKSTIRQSFFGHKCHLTHPLAWIAYQMTLKSYDAAMLDELALRLYDIAGAVRGMARRTRESGLERLPIHDRKVLQWCACLERWRHRTQAGLEVEIQAVKATRRARRLATNED